MHCTHILLPFAWCVQAPHLLHLTKAHICVVLLKHPECILPLTFLTPCNSIWTHTKLNLHCISAKAQAFVWDHSKDLAAVTVAWIEIYGFIASKCLWHKGLRKYIKYYKQERFYPIMQNCSLKEWLQAGKILQCRTALWSSGRVLHFCLNSLLLSICHTVSIRDIKLIILLHFCSQVCAYFFKFLYIIFIKHPQQTEMHKAEHTKQPPLLIFTVKLHFGHPILTLQVLQMIEIMFPIRNKEMVTEFQISVQKLYINSTFKYFNP
jgi:hypothetical protein